MKYLINTIFSLFLAVILLSSCKKTPTPSPDYFMRFEANNQPISYTACYEDEIIFNNSPLTQITGFYKATGNVGDKQFRITFYQDENNLKTGQVYTSQSINSLTYNNAVKLAFLPDSLVNNYYGYTTAAYNPTGTVTLTEVTPTSIKGTFSAILFNPSDFYGVNVAYTIINGTFYSNHYVNRQVIPL